MHPTGFLLSAAPMHEINMPYDGPGNPAVCVMHLLLWPQQYVQGR